ncbi:MAG: efflux RND transporter periplasmic adaptor subunit [Saprospiraceae bacterium]
MSIVGAGLVIILAIAGMKFLAGQKEAPARKPAETLRKEVEILPAQNGKIASTLEVQGQLSAFDKAEIYAEVGGLVTTTKQPFKVGTRFAKGAPMLVLDNTEARLALLAQKSTLLNAIAQAMPDLKIDYSNNFSAWEDYLNNFDVEKPITPLPATKSDQEKRFIAARNLYTQYYNIKSQEERLSKYTLYAPFSGVLTEATVNAGTVIRTGQKLGTLMATGNYEMVATVPMADLAYIHQGGTVQLVSEDIPGQWNGVVKRISDQIDAGSQTVQVFISVSGSELREGMYLHGDVTAKDIDNAIRLPRSLLVNQRAVYEVQDSILKLREIELVKMEAESAIVRGIPDGTPLLAKMVPGAFDGMKVKSTSPSIARQ